MERILVVDDEAVIREGLRRILEPAGYQAVISVSGQEGLERIQQEEFSLVITDLKMPGLGGMEVLKAIKILQPAVPVVIITGYSTIETAVEAIRNGAFDYLPKPFTPEQILEKVQRGLQQRLQQGATAEAPACTSGFDHFVGRSKAMEKIFRRILQVAPTDSTVLITGESGTGKELAARAIHGHSPRHGQPFVAVDCTALAESLLESELFGHVKGSFTGATHSKPGLFRLADGGTLFLDEVANITLTTQAKLLRVLQERKVTPIGGSGPSPVDIRLVAASNRSLRDMVARGQFREDLFFRLNIIPVDLPPLRERPGDLPLLIEHFLRKFARETGKRIEGLAPLAFNMLESYPFPGNVRELENIIERAVVLAEGNIIQAHDLELSLHGVEIFRGEERTIPETAEELKELKKRIREQAVEPIERAFALKALEKSNWNISKAAEQVGMLRPNFQALLKKQGINGRGRAEVTGD